MRTDGTNEASVLSERRAAIQTLVREIDRLPARADDATLLALVRSGLSTGPLAPLGHTRGGIDSLADQALHEYRRFSGSAASNASDRSHAVGILLLQCLDLIWWGNSDEYGDDRAISEDSELIDLRDERRLGAVKFSFAVAPRGYVGRVRDLLAHRLRPHRRPRGPGMRYTRARRAMLAVLNEIADRVAAHAPAGTPAMWVTSITRSSAYQEHLNELGFSALMPSAHCSGWAADIDAAWFERYGAPSVLREVLDDYLSRGILNVIDGTGAWHVCLNPLYAREYGDRELSG